MSDFKVPFTKIIDIQPHNNAERLAVATIYGFQVIIPKDVYQIGQKVIYVPIDSILPTNVETILFPETSKVKLTNSRVRQIKLRGLASQGMVINPEELAHLVNFNNVALEQDLSEHLKITKYEPPVKGSSMTVGKPGGRKAMMHPDFHSYNSLNNIKWFPNLFTPETEVIIQEKLHGTNARAAILPFRNNTFWRKVKSLFGLNPKYENLYGSNRVDISSARTYKGFYGEDVYGKTFAKIDAFNKIKPNETVFGEIIGPGIQKGYSYGLKEHTFVLFDVKILEPDGTHVWLNPGDVELYAQMRGFEFVPVLYRGLFDKDKAYRLTFGKSEYGDKSEKVREGIVLKSKYDYSKDGNKMALKFISEDYLNDKTNTDEH